MSSRLFYNHPAGHPPFTKTFSATIKYIKISLKNIHVCFVAILLDILWREDVQQYDYKTNVNVIYTYFCIFYCSTECLCEGRMFSRMVTKQTWKLFTFICIYCIVALNVFVKGGCPAGWLQNKRECYLNLFLYIWL
jgi:hypothetical protein